MTSHAFEKNLNNHSGALANSVTGKGISMPAVPATQLKREAAAPVQLMGEEEEPMQMAADTEMDLDDEMA
jgi:hypothetical protein